MWLEDQAANSEESAWNALEWSANGMHSLGRVRFLVVAKVPRQTELTPTAKCQVLERSAIKVINMELIKAVACSLFTAAFLVSGKVQAGEIWDEEALGYFSTYDIKFSDQVKDGCLPQPKTIQTSLELEALRSGMKIKTEQNTFPPQLSIMLVGYESSFASNGRPSGLCIASIFLAVDTLISHKPRWAGEKDKVGFLRIYDDGGVFSGPKNEFQRYAEEAVEKFMKEFLLVWTKARQRTEEP
jgi:hypothetical protein